MDILRQEGEEAAMGVNVTRAVVCRAVLVSLLFFSASLIKGQTSTQSASSPRERRDETQLLSALIDEVRKLRLTLEQNSALQHRSNLLLARIRRQEDLIHEITVEIRTLDKDMTDLADGSRYDDEADDLQDVEARINETTDPSTRQELVHEYNGIKRRLDRKKQSDKEELERKRELKPKFEEKLREQQDVLIGMNSQLEAFERDLELQMKTALSQSVVQTKQQ
jgi:hypothetical protein